MSALDRARAAHRSAHRRTPTILTRAPGRVNLIGEHTDYNDGFALPMALPFDVAIAAHADPTGHIVATSEGFAPAHAALTSAPDPATGWIAYVHGIAHLLDADDHRVAGWTGCIASDIPAGASLSSSAALTMAAGLAALAAAGSTIDPIELALTGQRVENEVLGFPSGNLDQIASVSGRRGSASLIDCRELTVTPVPLPPGVTVIIMDTGTRRQLVDSEYASRRADCERAAAALGVGALRDVSLADVARLEDPLLQRCARHVVSENERTLAAAEAMRLGDAVETGRLMSASHDSLRDDYEVTGPALDAIVDIARSQPGCHGARMTGGGFAGGCVALGDSERTDDFMVAMGTDYDGVSSQPAVEPVRYWPVHPAPGAEVVES